MLFRRNSWNGTSGVSRSPARLLLFGLLFFCLPGAAQQPPPDAHTLRVDVQLVNVDVTVVDKQGKFVSGLAAQNFRLREDGAPQTVAHFLPTQAPVRIALLVETARRCFSSATTTWPPPASCSPGCAPRTKPRSSPTPARLVPSSTSPATKPASSAACTRWAGSASAWPTSACSTPWPRRSIG